MKIKTIIILGLMLSGIESFSQKTLFWPTEWNDPNNEFYNNVSNTRRYESTNFVLYWGDKVGNDPSTYSDAALRFNPRSVADTLEYSFKRYITDLHFINNDPSTNFGKYKIIIMMMGTWNSTDDRLQAFAQASSYSNTIGAMFVHPGATRDGGALCHEFAHCLQMMMHIQENPGNQTAFTGYDWAGSFYETHANFMRGQAYQHWADIDGTLTRWIQTRHFMWSSMRHHYTSFHLLYYVQEKDGFDLTRRLWAESTYQEHPLQTLKRLKGFTQEQLCDYLWGYAQRQPAFDYPIQWNSQINNNSNFGMVIRSTYQFIKNSMPRYTSRQYTILTQVEGTTNQFYTNDDWAPQDYGMNIIPLYPTCTEIVKNVNVKFKGHTEVNNSQAGWRYGFVTTKSDGTISRYSPMYSAADGEVSFTLNSANEASIYFVVFSAPKVHVNYNMDVGYPKQRRYPYEITIANAMPEGYQPAANFRSWLKTNGHLHSNGGGWVSNNASVATTVYVGPYAMVRGGTVSGNVRIEDWATVDGGNVSGNAIIRENAWIYNATVSTSAIVEGNAWMEGGSASGTVNIKGNAMVWGASYGNAVVVGGDAEIGSCSTNGVYLQPPYWRNGRTECDGKGATDASNIDINATFTNFTTAQMAFNTTPACGTAVNYTLTTTVVGSGTVSPASGTYSQGTAVTLTATPSAGYVFSGWSGDASGTTNPLSVTMNANMTITATFTQIDPTLLQKYEFEDGNWLSSLAAEESTNTGFSGRGYVNTVNQLDSWTEITIPTVETGLYELVITYASLTDRPVSLSVNGTVVQSSLAMPLTGSWTVWTTITLSLNLTQGNNTIRFIATSAAGTANLDFLTIKMKSTVIQTISLDTGWNLISINVDPSDNTISTLFKNLNVQSIKTISEFWYKDQVAFLNTLTTITPGEGYLVNMNEGGILSIEGVTWNHSLNVEQKEGWQLIGCPYQTSTLFSTYFNSSNCEIIKNFEGFWIPNGTQNSIQNLEPGKGYFIK